MRDHLLDLVEHTYDLGCIDLVKITGDDKTTVIDGLAEDRSVVVQAAFKQPVSEFVGTFGMPNLDKLALHLKNPEYQKDAKIEVVTAERNGETMPTHIHFENVTGDFQNDYRFMNRAIIDENLRRLHLKVQHGKLNFSLA